MGIVFDGKIWAKFGQCRTLEKSGIVLQIEKSAESSDDDLTWYVFRFEEAVPHLTSSNSRAILIVEK